MNEVATPTPLAVINTEFGTATVTYGNSIQVHSNEFINKPSCVCELDMFVALENLDDDTFFMMTGSMFPQVDDGLAIENFEGKMAIICDDVLTYSCQN